MKVQIVYIRRLKSYNTPYNVSLRGYFMNVLNDVKTIGEQLLSLSVELLRLLDADEQERLAIIERVKKTVKSYRFHYLTRR